MKDILYVPASSASDGLFTSPKDGADYYRRRARMQQLVDSANFAAAEPLADRLVQEYSRDGTLWLTLARIKSNLGKFDDAAVAYQRGGSLNGWENSKPAYNAAINYLRAGKDSAAVEALRRAIFSYGGLMRWQLYNGAAYSGFRKLREFDEIVGRQDTAGWNRNDGWIRDVQHLYSEVRRVNPDYSHETAPPAFISRYEALLKSVPQLSDEQIIVGMAGMLASLGQGHTGVWDLTKPDSRIRAKRLPLQIYHFPEGLFITHAEAGYEELIGSRVVAIGGVPAAQAIQRLHSVTSVDGPMEYLFRTYYLQEAALLKGLGLTNSMDSAVITVEKAGGSTAIVTVPTSGKLNWFKLPAPLGVTTPLYLKNVAQAHWEILLPEHDALYLQFNQVANDKEETLPEFGRRMRALFASKQAPKNLILDVRHNNGGNSNLYTELLRSVIAFSTNEDHKLFVLIGRGTYSAAANFITELDRLANPIFVGEASSECCTFYGDAAWVHLPYSGVEVSVSGAKWMLGGPFDARREMTPDVPVQLTAREYFEGKDPALEAVFRLLAGDAK